MRKHSEAEVAEFCAERAGEMRAEPTPAEARAWEFLKPMGFERQFPLEGLTKNFGVWFYILDFVHRELKLVVEIDGGVHKRTRGRDRRRDTRLASEGITTLRLSNREVLRDAGSAKAKVEKAMERLGG